MARPCSVCQHSDRQSVDAALASGTPIRNVAKQFQVTAASMFRHSKHLVHEPRAIRDSADFDVVAELRSRLAHADKLTNIAEGLVGRAAQQGDWRTAIAGIGAATRALSEARACLELQARIAGRLDAAVDERLTRLEEQLQQFVQRPWANRWSA
jgi:hypothetical protein